MEKLTVYGLPITNAYLPQIAGGSFCVSYATRKRLGRQLEDAIRLVGQDGILLVDNGAFTNHKQGKSSFDADYLEGFAAWANDITARCPQAVVVIPDVIGGTEAQNADLLVEAEMMLDAGDRLMPIWHMHESLDYLIALCQRFAYIGFGSSGEYWNIGTEKWHARMREAFAAIDAWEAANEGAYVRPRIHMMRAQSMAHLYPFDSSDSTNVAMNHERFRRVHKVAENHVGALAARVDGKIQSSAGPAAAHQVAAPLNSLWTEDMMIAQAMKWLENNRPAVVANMRQTQLELPLAA